MANHAYLSLWCRNYSTGNMLVLYERLLELFPASEQKPGFYSFTIRAISPQETPIIEQDASSPLEPAMVTAMAQEFLHDDCAFELVGYWNLWHSSVAQGKLVWTRKPARVEFACFGMNYDDAVAQDSGHFFLQLNFEHLYVGHASLILGDALQASAGAERVEEEFLRVMADTAAREEYRLRTRANIQKLFDYVEQLEKHLPIERRRLWSEGEPDFEAKMRLIHSA